MLRVGASGEQMVSTGNGGWAAELNKDGSVNKRALYMDVEMVKGGDDVAIMANEKVKWIDTSSKTEPGYRVPALDKVFEKVREIHPMMPQLKWIGWDFTINDKAEPVLIEFNTASSIMVQFLTCKPVFGDMTEYILDDFFIHRTMEKNHQQGYIPS